MSRTTIAHAGTRPRASISTRLRRKLGRMVEPKAARLLDWCRAGDENMFTVVGRIASLEARADRGEWGRDALVERMNDQDCEIEHALNTVDELEPLVQDAYWGRSALVERFNDADCRTSLVDDTIKSMQTQIDEYVIRPLALELDTLAMSRRLATIEDQLELLLAQNAIAEKAV